MTNQSSRSHDLNAPLGAMADLLKRVQEDEALGLVRRRNLASSIRRLCELLDIDIATTPASFQALRDPLARFEPAAAGIRKQRFQTIRSDVSFALKRYTIATAPVRLPLSNSWREVRERGRSYEGRIRLHRLIQWCNDRDIAPNEVDDGVIADLHAHFEHETFKSKAQQRIRLICLYWNKLVPVCDDLGLRSVSMPKGRDTYGVDIETMPASFQAEVEAWFDQVSSDADLFDLDAPPTPLKPATLDCYRYVLQRILGALKRQGHDLTEIRDLADLVDLNRVRDAIDFFRRRGKRGDDKLPDHNVMRVLRLVAKRTRPNDSELHERLQRAGRRLSPGPRDMGRRPKAALKQFDAPTAIDRLVALPAMAFARLSRKRQLDRSDALDFQAALVVELLLMRPIRRANLAQLRLGEHVHIGGNSARIRIPGDDVKNGEPLDYPLPEPTRVMLVSYIQRALPLFGPNPNGFLFPGARPDRHKADSLIGEQFARFVRRRTGLRVTVHLMRQIAARLYLDAVPEGMETVRQVLGHRSVETTARAYVGLRQDAALRRYDEVVLLRRGRALGED